MNPTQILKHSGDYYYCSSCNTWHRLRPNSKGQQHLIYFDESKTNSPLAKYYYCSSCGKWHKGSYEPHLSHRVHIKFDGKIELSKISATSMEECASKEVIIGEFDAAEGLLWKSFEEHLNAVGMGSLRQRCEDILKIGTSLEEHKVQCFSRRDG